VNRTSGRPEPGATGKAISRRHFLERGAARLGAAPLVLSACRKEAQPDEADPPFDRRTLVGAHYYLWYPALFEGGRYLRAQLQPPQPPLLGEYSSSSTAVVERHIEWAWSSGIDFFTLDWWPGLPRQNQRIEQAILAARNISYTRFCIFYELGGLGYDPRSGFTVFDGPKVERFLSDMEEIANRYFAHPRHLRVQGRPVIVLYVTRTAVGRFEEAMVRYRARMAEVGVDPFVIGDEIFWEVAREDGTGHTAEPQRRRVSLFDAITAYNLYDASRPGHTGYGATGVLLADAQLLYERYRGAAAGTPLVPLALPGYNDRGLRLEADHPAIPREWAPGAGEGTFFVEWLRRFTLPQIDTGFPMMLVTSWNEWSEDTAIEPAVQAPATASDRSSSATAYTQGFSYRGYGTRYLDILREQTRR